jgi:DNA polymerase
VHHRPPENRDPLPSEILAYGKYLDKIIEIIDPRVIITLGRFSMGKFLPNAKITSVHGKIHRVNWQGKEFIIIPMYHPAAALRNPEVMRQEKEDFLKLPGIFIKLDEESKKENPPAGGKVEQMNLI